MHLVVSAGAAVELFIHILKRRRSSARESDEAHRRDNAAIGVLSISSPKTADVRACRAGRTSLILCRRSAHHNHHQAVNNGQWRGAPAGAASFADTTEAEDIHIRHAAAWLKNAQAHLAMLIKQALPRSQTFK